MTKRLFFYLSFLFISPILPQAELIPIEHPVYFFLYQQYLKGNLNSFDQIILPLNRYVVEEMLVEVDYRRTFLSKTETELLDLFQNYFRFRQKTPDRGIFSESRIPLYTLLYEEEENHFINYKDTLVKFTFDPRAALKAVRSNNSGIDSVSRIMQYGGKFVLNIGSNLAFELDAWNGNVYSSRSSALYIPEVAQSFTFNNTGLNNFDGTSGYINYRHNIFNLHFGRNRILWGRGVYDKLTIGGNSQLFDFLKFDLKYKSVNYSFLHGWLAGQVTETVPDSVNKLKIKQSKYIAVSRLGYQHSRFLKMGISQSVIYGDRALEAAYLNPFLFWESAQRSMNDIDNSFLTFDISILPINGLEVTSTLLLDDIHFGNYLKDGLDSKSNRSALQLNVTVSDPIFFPDFRLIYEYIVIRPFTFSHPGYGQTTAYTNNGFNLGPSLEPNSLAHTIAVKGFVFSNLCAEAGFRFIKHGANQTDSTGKIVRNVGGDINLSYNYFTPAKTPLLDGVLEISRSFFLHINYYLSYHLTLTTTAEFHTFSAKTKSFRRVFFVSLSYGFL